MTIFRSLAIDLHKAGFNNFAFPSEKHTKAYQIHRNPQQGIGPSEEGSGTLHYQTYYIDLKNPDKMIEVAKKIVLSNCFEKIQRWILVKIADSGILCARATKWANTNLQNFGRKKLCELFPNPATAIKATETLHLPDGSTTVSKTRTVNSVWYTSSGIPEQEYYKRCFIGISDKDERIIYCQLYADAFMRKPNNYLNNNQ